MTWQRIMYLLTIFMFLGLSLCGCGDSNVFSSMSDDNSSEALQDKSLDAINAGDYNSAIAILKTLPSSADNDRYLSSSYAGRAGFDALDLIATISAEEESGPENSDEMFNTISEMFEADGSGAIPNLDLKIDDMGEAINLLAPEGTPDDGNSFQAGLYGSTQAVLIISNMLSSDVYESQTIKSIRLLPAGSEKDQIIENLIYENFSENEEALNDSIRLVDNASENLTANLTESESNDIADDMDELLVDIGYFPADGGGADGITPDELIAYLTQLSPLETVE